MSTLIYRKIRRMKVVPLFIGAVLTGMMSAFAIPTLQLDIGGGTYSDGTTVANASTFDLYALLSPDKDSRLSDVYRISVALYPKTANSSPAPAVGTFSLNGTTYNVAGDMAWGRPPDALLSGTTEIGTTLPPHEIFDTYFMELNVVFDANKLCQKYDVAENPGDPVITTAKGIYYQNFALDVSGLSDGYGIHFDLYQLAAGEKGGNGKKVKDGQILSTDIVEFAPFLNDAESRANVPRTNVPDGASTVTLLGLALAGIAAVNRRMHG